MIVLYKNHKWETLENGIQQCVKCGINRKKKTFKILMAIDGGRNYYKYSARWVYNPFFKEATTTLRPNCS